MTRGEYISAYAKTAAKSTRGTKLFPSVMLAQGVIESDNGNSYPARMANNHFGIKCHGTWKGQTIRAKDDKPNECFRKYNSVLDSFRDRNKFLTENPRYTSHGVFSADTPQQQAKALQAAGYATSKSYGDVLMFIIEKYDLTQYDQHIVQASFLSDIDAKLLPERMMILMLLFLIIYVIYKLYKSLK